MRAFKFLLATVVLAMPLVALAPADDAVDWATPPGEGWTETTGGWVSGSVQYVMNVPLDVGGAADAVLRDDLLYLTSWHGFSIYDVSIPEAPQRLSTVPMDASMWNEQPQTNGEILLVSSDTQYLPPTEHARGGGVLEIYDVSDPTAPSPLPIATYESELQDSGVPGFYNGYRDHLWTCLFDCDYAYGAGGTILDLQDPQNPTKIGMWTDQAPIQALHHIREVAPGIVLTGSVPMYVLDARESVASPTVMATIHPEIWDTPTAYAGTPRTIQNPTALPGRVDWPDALNGRLSIVTKETPFTGECGEDSGDVETFLTPGWRDTRTFVSADSYQISENGTYSDGAPAYNALGCSAYGLDVHPSFGQAGGPAAVTFFEHGIRVLDIDAEGRIGEAGGFLPIAGNSLSALWVTDEILYSIDAQRGIDILHVSSAD